MSNLRAKQNEELPIGAASQSNWGVQGWGIMARQVVPKDNYVIEAGWALLPDGDSLKPTRDVAIVVQKGIISDIADTRIAKDLPRIDARTQLVLPGLICGHTHCASGSATRGLIESGRYYTRPLEFVESLSEDELDDLTAYNLAELIRSGATTLLEMSLSHRQMESFVRVARRWNVRAFVGSMIPDVNRVTPIWERSYETVLADAELDTLAEIERYLDFARRLDSNNGLMLPMIAAHAADTHTDATLMAIAAGARELGTGVHIHVSQRARETTRIRAEQGLTPVQWLEKLGCFDGPLFAAHMTGMDLNIDPAIMTKHGAVYAHCPSAGGAGAASQPYPEALAAGMRVNVAVDTHSNDMIENLKLAVLYGRNRARHLHETSVAPMVMPSVHDAIAGTTILSARGLHRNDLGRLSIGAAADITTIDVSGLLVGAGALPPDPLNNLLYASGTQVRNVIVAGRPLVHDGHLVDHDEVELIQRGGTIMQKIWRQLESEDWLDNAPQSPFLNLGGASAGISSLD